MNNLIVLDAYYGQCHIIPLTKKEITTIQNLVEAEKAVMAILDERKIHYSWADSLWCVNCEIINHAQKGGKKCTKKQET